LTAKDAWRKDGRFKDFINEGGGMNFLTHQGTEAFAQTAGKASPGLTPKWRHVKEALSKVNEFSEIWTRLAIRERAIRNGKDPVEATWIARNYLDFSQGGWFTKGIDNVIPYLNASTQAFRTTAREAKKHPGRFATKAMWLQATAANMWITNYFTNPEGWANVTPQERRENWVIMTPFHFQDQMGNRRDLYFKIKKDNTMVPLTSLPEMLLEKYVEGRVPDDAALDTLKSSVPVVPTDAIPPTMSAYMSYASNHDFWTDDKIWRGPEDIKPEDEFNMAPRQPTSMFWREFGYNLGMSPERSAASSKKVLPINPYTSLAGIGYKMATEGMNEYDKSQHVLQMLNDTPILRRLVGLTHPASRELDAIEDMEREGGSAKYDLTRKLDNLYFQDKQDELPGGQRTIRSWIAAQPPEERDRLARRLETQRAYDRIMGPSADMSGVPSRTWWAHVGQTDAITRADIFYWKWRDNDAMGRRKMETISGRMSAQGLGFRTDDFNRRLSQLKKFWGTDYYGEGESREPKETPRDLR